MNDLKAVLRVKLKLIDVVVLLFFVWGYGRIPNSCYRPVLMLLGIMPVVLMLVRLIRNKKIDTSILSYGLFLLLFLVFIPISQEKGVALSYLLAYGVYFFPYVVFKYYETSERAILSLSKIVCLILIYLVLLSICSIIVYIMNPGIARSYASHKSDLLGLMIGGGYQLAYVGAILLPFLYCMAIYSSNKVRYIILFFIDIILLWKTSSLITLVAGFCGVGVLIFLRGELKRKFLMSVFFIGLVVVFLCMRSSIGDFLIDISDGKVVYGVDGNLGNAIFMRINEVGFILKGTQVGSLEASGMRFANFVRPINHILKYPLTGSLFITGVNPQEGVFNDSSILTALACWGIPMSLLYFTPFFSSRKKYKEFVGCAITAFLLLLFNPSEGFAVYATCFFLLPSISLLKERDLKVFV